MQIAHYIKTSMVDYQPYIASVVFTKGCNMICDYCHNKGLLTKDDAVDIEDIMNHLVKRKDILDGVVITGGEPTLHSDLPDFISDIKSLGYRVKLDTNGTNPDMVEFLSARGLIDYIALDIKALPEDYKRISGLGFESIDKTLSIIRSFGSYELRTTAYPKIGLVELEQMCQRFISDPYYLQQYRGGNSINDIKPYADEVLKKLGDAYNINVRGL